MYPLQLRVEVNEVSDSSYFFPGKLWQSGAGHKVSYLQFMQTSALLRKASFFSQNLAINLAFLFFWKENSFSVDVAVQFSTNQTSPPPCLRASVGSGRYLTWSGKSHPFLGVNGNFATDLLEIQDFSPDILKKILMAYSRKQTEVFYHKKTGTNVQIKPQK